MSVYISKRAYASILSEIKSFSKIETGGVLLGYYNKEQWFVIESIFSGPKAVHEHSSFEYDFDYTQYQLNKLIEIYEEPLCILGLWHSHINKSMFSFADDDANLKFASLNPYGAISGIFDVTERNLSFFEVRIPLEYKEIDWCINADDRISNYINNYKGVKNGKM